MRIIMIFESWIIVVVRFNELVCLFVIEALLTQRRVVRKTDGDNVWKRAQGTAGIIVFPFHAVYKKIMEHHENEVV